MWKKSDKIKQSNKDLASEDASINSSSDAGGQAREFSTESRVRAQHELPKIEQSTIGRSVRLKGDIHAKENLYIQGEVEGTVCVDGHTLRVGRNGRLAANVFAKTIHIEGILTGDLYGAEQVVIHKTGRVQGNIVAPRVIVEDGANVRGKIDMDPHTIEKHFPKQSAEVPKATHLTDNIIIPKLTAAKGTAGTTGTAGTSGTTGTRGTAGTTGTTGTTGPIARKPEKAVGK